MKTTTNAVQVQVRKLEPTTGYHLKNINTGDMYESVIYLGAYDSEDNYVEVTEEEYQAYLKKQEEDSEIVEPIEE